MDPTRYRQQTLTVLKSRWTKPPSRRVLDALAGEGVELPAFENAGELVRFQWKHGTDPRQDAIHRALLRVAAKEPQDREAPELLLSAMLPVLDGMFFVRVKRAKCGRTQEARYGQESWTDECWATVVGAFTKVIRRYPIDRFPTRVGSHLEGRLLNELVGIDRRSRRGTRAERRLARNVAPLVTEAADPHDDVPPLGLFDLTRDEEKPAPHLPEEVASAKRLLRAWGVTSKREVAVLLGVVVHERSYRDVAASMGIRESNARKIFERIRRRIARLKTHARPK